MLDTLHGLILDPRKGAGLVRLITNQKAFARSEAYFHTLPPPLTPSIVGSVP